MNLFDREREAFLHTYRRLPIAIDRGDGAYLYDTTGKRYIDLLGGLAVNSLGHAHEDIVRAICEQSARFIHLSNAFVATSTLSLAESLKRHSGCHRVFLTNSGTEAIEGALKLVRLWGAPRDRQHVISFTGAFHGRTYGALSLMNTARYKEGFGPFLPNCAVLPFNDAAALRAHITSSTAAVFTEFIQGEAGVIPASEEFADTLETLRRRYGFLLVADEIQSGLGRTGASFAYSHYRINPDIVVIAKPLGGGLPLGAILGMEVLGDVFDIGQHGSTFGGNPVACAAGCVVMREIFESGLMKRVAVIGDAFIDELKMLEAEFPTVVKDVRGRGLMIGIELFQPGAAVAADLLDEGVLVNCTSNNVLRLLPPLLITSEQLSTALAAIRRVLGRAH